MLCAPSIEVKENSPLTEVAGGENVSCVLWGHGSLVHTSENFLAVDVEERSCSTSRGVSCHCRDNF